MDILCLFQQIEKRQLTPSSKYIPEAKRHQLGTPIATPGDVPTTPGDMISMPVTPSLVSTSSGLRAGGRDSKIIQNFLQEALKSNFEYAPGHEERRPNVEEVVLKFLHQVKLSLSML